MARLSDEKVRELILKPMNMGLIQRAALAEERLVMHCEAIEQENGLPRNAWQAFLAWVKPMLSEDKFKRFLQFISYPLATVDLTESIFDELSKVLTAQDRYIRFDFVTGELEQDFVDYQQYRHDKEFFTTHAIEWMKTSINSIIVVDLPSQQTTTNPEPYYYKCPICNVHDIGFNPNTNAVEYIIINQGKNRKVILDDEFYRVAVKADNEDQWVITSAPHSSFDELGNVLEGLGYCPAIDFYGKAVKGTNGIVKKGPITKSLGKMDWLLVTEISMQYMKMYGQWPIIVKYKNECEYKDETHDACEGGRIRRITQNGNGSDETAIYDACPNCIKSSLLGPGSVFEVDAPQEGSDPDLAKSAITFVEMSTQLLEYVTKDIDRQQNNIFINSVGYGGDVLNEQAVNEGQVSANFEAKEAVLDNIRTQLERCYKFAWDTAAILRYGRNAFKGSVVDLGNEYYLKSVEGMNAEYKSAKDNGMPQYILADNRNAMSRAKYKNNPELALRSLILSKLEPYADYKPEDLPLLLIPQLDPKGYVLKLNFDRYITRFEKENGSIVQFGSLLPFDEKVTRILTQLELYGQQQLQSAESGWNTSGSDAPAPGAANGGATA